MDIQQVSEFKAIINGVEFSDEQDFSTSCFILDCIEDRFNISISDPEFTQDLKVFIETAARKIESFSHAELEHATEETIRDADTFSDIRMLANVYDSEDNYWNRKINAKINEPCEYRYIVGSITTSIEESNTMHKEAIEINKETLEAPIESIPHDRERLYDDINEYVTNNFLHDLDPEFEELYPIKTDYDTSISEYVPSIYDKKTTIFIGTKDSTDMLFEPELIHKALMSRGESLYTDDLSGVNRYIPLERETPLYKNFVEQLNIYLLASDRDYYVDVQTGAINDSHLSFNGNEIITELTTDGYPGETALYNYLPVAIAKGMATNQIDVNPEILAQLPDIMGNEQYQVFKQELEYIYREYPNQINISINKNGMIESIDSYKGLYNGQSGSIEITNIDDEWSRIIKEYNVMKDRENRPIAAIIKSGFESKDCVDLSTDDGNEIFITIKQFEDLLSNEEKQHFKEQYLSIDDVLVNSNSGLNFTKFDKTTQAMMESYVRLEKSGELPTSLQNNKQAMKDIIQFSMEQQLVKELEKRAEQAVVKEQKKPSISISKPKGNNGLER